MTGDYEIKVLRESDVDLLQGLLGVFARAFEEPDRYLEHQPQRSYLREMLRKAHFLVVVAVADDAVVGGLAAYLLDKFEQDRREIYIYDLAVDEAHRRRGIAKSLLEELRRLAVERDAYVIFVQADIEDAPAIALYQSLGEGIMAIQFDIPVVRPPDAGGPTRR